MATETKVWPDITIPPGELLAETLESLGMSQAELARRAGRPVQAINEIVKGVKEITPETALQLERVLGVPAHIWIRLDADYRHNRARLQDFKRLEGEIPLAERYPYTHMVRLGWVPNVKDSVERVIELLKFFRVSDLRNLKASEPLAAWRRSMQVEVSPEALLAWLMRGRREAERIEVGLFDKDMLQKRLPELRPLTREQAEVFENGSVGLLSECGVALVFIPHLPKTGAQGATQWIGDKAIVQLSVRYKWSDIFWFSLFHEIGHLLLHHHKGVFVNPDSGRRNSQEKEADRFAADELIPPAEYQVFISSTNFRSPGAVAAVLNFANVLRIAPSIVVGRLQHDHLLPHSHLNDLRDRFELVSTS